MGEQCPKDVLWLQEVKRCYAVGEIDWSDNIISIWQQTVAGTNAQRHTYAGRVNVGNRVGREARRGSDHLAPLGLERTILNG